MTTYVRGPDVLWRSCLDGLLLLRDSGGEAVHITGSAFELWQLFAHPRSVDSVGAEIAALYRLPVDEVLPHVREVVDQLVGQGILRGVTR